MLVAEDFVVQIALLRHSGVYWVGFGVGRFCIGKGLCVCWCFASLSLSRKPIVFSRS